MSRTDDSPTETAPASTVSVETLLQGIPDAVVVADIEAGRVVTANQAAGTLFECHPDDLVGLDHMELHPSEEADLYREAIRRGFETGQVDRLRDDRPLQIETLDGQCKPVEVNARPITDDDRSLVLGVFRDVSDRLERERKLQRARTRLETLLDATPLPVAVLDTDGTVDRWNQAAEETFGYPSEAVRGDLYPLFVDDEEFETVFERILDDGMLSGYESVHRARDGSLLSVELYARPLSRDGTVTGVIGAAIDVTDQQRRVQQLEALHRILRHNLRNQLAVIRGMAQRLPSTAGSGATDLDARAEIIDASDALLDLSNQAKEMQRLLRTGVDSDESRSLRELLTMLAEAVREGTSGCTATVSPPTEPATVPSGIEPALTRLLETILDGADHRTLAFTGEVRDRHVVVTVEGTTPLLSKQERASILAGEETALEHEEGLRVTHASLLVQAAGGSLSIPTDHPSKTLRVQLPRAAAETEPASQSPE